MKSLGLTKPRPLARSWRMQRNMQRAGRSGRRVLGAAAVLLGGSLAISGCISVKAPEKPIVIDLNINIKQEVVYRLAADAGNTIQDNPQIF